ncbi:hypothetical protein K2173_000291 [Erythroxylum novogranatense]|uniref:FAD-binding PCMH-type domain-containing protein n=1 Tax=Erythroxylum novogranatense TaxID=1862640 RepID=A0AAV8SWS6_9ROSI|nr:hypothetical protein K2173_000291 [Erythroxylum novogranatense]
MRHSGLTMFPFLVAILFPLATSDQSHNDFLQCLYRCSENSSSISKLIYTPNNPSYSSVLEFSIQNLRFNTTTTPKPLLIVTPTTLSHIQASITCSRKHGLQVRVRSGGHDLEGLSYISYTLPFIIIDLINLRDISLDLSNRHAWVQAGATIGELYYALIKTTRTLAFPAGDCPSVGLGGHISGGGYGNLMRKYGLATDNVIDAQLIDVNGRILNRSSMGEDVFWAIRGGGGNTFGVVVAWKINLVPVPPTVTVFTVRTTEEKNATKLVHRWQYIANKLPEDLYILAFVEKTNSGPGGSLTKEAKFTGLFLGGINELLQLVEQRFRDLGLAKEDCSEMSWVESNLYFSDIPSGTPLEILLDRTLLKSTFKAKSDYLKVPMPETVFETVWKMLDEVDVAGMELIPYGGRMSEIPESSIPFPHRADNICKIGYLVSWDEAESSEKYISWIRKLYSYMGLYVSKDPREAYANYRDLDIGVNDPAGKTSYEKASIWGKKYFKNNFDRLVRVKTQIDPTNFFRNEQSVPSHLSK